MRGRWEAAGNPRCIEWLEQLEELRASQKAKREKDDRVSETVESDDQAFSGADNCSSSQIWYAQQGWHMISQGWLHSWTQLQ